MPDFQKANGQIAESVVSGYKKIEDGVVGGYKKIESGVVGAFKKVEDQFVGGFLTHEGETVDGAKARLAAEQAAREKQARTRKSAPPRSGLSQVREHVKSSLEIDRTGAEDGKEAGTP